MVIFYRRLSFFTHYFQNRVDFADLYGRCEVHALPSHPPSPFPPSIPSCVRTCFCSFGCFDMSCSFCSFRFAHYGCFLLVLLVSFCSFRFVVLGFSTCLVFNYHPVWINVILHMQVLKFFNFWWDILNYRRILLYSSPYRKTKFHSPNGQRVVF